jgi:hypothetical protein
MCLTELRTAIGKYLYVKGYLATGNIPAESNTAKAGTDTP